MKRYLLNFWIKRSPENPQGEWERYYKTVKQVDKKYRTPIMPGYKTSRGRVFLQYGPPYLIETSMSERDVRYPYEIWQYDQLESASTTYQVNRVFVFVNYMLGSNDFELTHSDAVGEVYDPSWKLKVQDPELNSGNQSRERTQTTNGNNIIRVR